MRRGPGGALSIKTSTARNLPVRALLISVLPLGTAVLAGGCGFTHPVVFHPKGVSATAPMTSSRPASPRLARLAPFSSDSLIWPPFGRDVRITMPAWLPGDPTEVPAVITAKNFLLAFLYAEYTGNTDHRWAAFASPDVAQALGANLAAPDVTTESFTGAIWFSQMNAFADPSVSGAVDVSECFNNARSFNVGLHSRKVITDSTPPDQHYYRNTDVLARNSTGRWQVVSIYPVIYYPQARECKA
jgi:hypothetical protein